MTVSDELKKQLAKLPLETRIVLRQMLDESINREMLHAAVCNERVTSGQGAEIYTLERIVEQVQGTRVKP